jgi:hypothetical protein
MATAEEGAELERLWGPLVQHMSRTVTDPQTSESWSCQLAEK